MRGAFATFAVIAAVVLAGCTSTPGHPDPTTAATPAPTTTPVVSDPPDTGSAPTSPPPVTGTDIPADVPTTGPNLRHNGERPPAMPLLATKHTRAGAVAFAQFFIQTIDWGFATMDDDYMDHYFLAQCQSCVSLSEGIAHARQQGHRYTGGRFAVRNARALKDSSQDGRVSIAVTVDATAFEETTRSGAFYQGDPGHRGEVFTVAVTWKRGVWRVVSLSVSQ